MMAVAEQKNREQRQLENERWKAYVKAMKAAGRPPKSAGIKNVNKRGAEKKTDAPEGVSTGSEPAVEGQQVADAESKTPSTPPKTDGAKRKPQPRKKKAAAKTSTEAPEASAAKDETASTEKSVPATAPGFTEYQLNVPPANITPVRPIFPLSLSS